MLSQELWGHSFEGTSTDGMANKNATFTSKAIQNDALEGLGCYVQSPVFEHVKKSKFFTLLCAETTDMSTQQQLTICLR